MAGKELKFISCTKLPGRKRLYSQFRWYPHIRILNIPRWKTQGAHSIALPLSHHFFGFVSQNSVLLGWCTADLTVNLCLPALDKTLQSWPLIAFLLPPLSSCLFSPTWRFIESISRPTWTRSTGCLMLVGCPGCNLHASWLHLAFLDLLSRPGRSVNVWNRG